MKTLGGFAPPDAEADAFWTKTHEAYVVRGEPLTKDQVREMQRLVRADRRSR